MSLSPPRELPRSFAPMGLGTAKLVSPRSIAEACARLAEAKHAGQRVSMLAGGTDWFVERQLRAGDRKHDVDLVVDLTRIDELTEVRAHEVNGEARLTLGGGVTYWMLRKDPRIAETIPMLAAMAADVGAVQIQTRGTLAGNIATASPAADGVPALMALDAVVTLRRAEGTRDVNLDRFFTSYRTTVMNEGELIAAIDVRVPAQSARARWRKVGTRLAQAISKVALASVIERDASGVITRARFGMASVAPTVSPLRAVRALVAGKKLGPIDRAAVGAALGQDIAPIDDVRSTAAYRTHVAEAIVWRALEG